MRERLHMRATEGPGTSGWGGWDPGEERGGEDWTLGRGGGERGGWNPGEGRRGGGRGPGEGRVGWDPGQGRKGVEKQGGAGRALPRWSLWVGGARWGFSDLGLRLFVHYLSENSC